MQRRNESSAPRRAGGAQPCKLAWRGLLALAMAGAPGVGKCQSPEAQLKAPVPAFDSADWQWQIPTSAAFTIRGALNKDAQGGNAGFMMYPAASGLMFLAAILTHATINSTARGVEEDRVQAEADKVLEPYRDILGQMNLPQVAQRVAAASPRLGEHLSKDPAAVQGGAWSVEATPLFVMARDARTISANVTIAVWPNPRTKEPQALRVVRVISTPIQDEKPEAVWRKDGGKRLQSTLDGLLAEALDIALMDTRVDSELPQRTVRYTDGANESVERGQVLKTACRRVVLRNLRGWLMSLPLPAEPERAEADPNCATTAQRLG